MTREQGETRGECRGSLSTGVDLAKAAEAQAPREDGWEAPPNVTRAAIEHIPQQSGAVPSRSC